ncbi:MAG: HD domain-containing protein [Spirochaetales bacterium]|uniref:HD domain-containing protein n=1 Tax=Candidatus Thalassospirochaeta sargassi TaxID=3119039 RepID=A0AAJ1ID19_9SPIO|nr:HD domain-containing protein [Spirochaetales bacterium]
MKDSILKYLNSDFTEPIRDPLWQNIFLSKGFKQLVSLEPFQKLAGIKQLGPAYHVYPGATHTRLSHSLGVFHLARRIISRLVGHPDCIVLTLEGVKSFLCAALLHDLGHFPYAHSLKELPLKDHEVLTGEIILSEPLCSCIENVIGASAKKTAAIVNFEMPHENDKEVIFFRNILSGVLDPDKLDYLNRDAFFCGVPYGIQDTDFAISKIVPTESGIGINSQGITAVENVLFSKYLMYRTVYWHKTVRIATAMIKKAVITALTEGIINNDDLYGLTDNDFFNRYTGDFHPVMQLITAVNKRNLYKCVYEVPFSADNSLHQSLCSLEARTEFEKNNTSNCGCSDLIIDIPEPISFEVNLPVVSGGSRTTYIDSESVFSGPVVEGFTSSLRKIRVYVPEADVAGCRHADGLFN